MTNIPFNLEFHLLDRRTLMVTASRGAVVVTENYRIGNSTDRREVGERLLADGRLHENHPLDLQVVIDALARAEVEVMRQVDTRDVDCTMAPASPVGDEPPKPSSATHLVNLALGAGIELWQELDGKGWATIPHGDGWTNTPLASGKFRKWLSRTYFQTEAKVPAANALHDAIQTLTGIAESERKVYGTHIRIAASDDKIYLDLADRDGNALEISPERIALIQRPAVKFRHSPAMMPLPASCGGGSLQTLRKYLNVASDDDFIMVVAWLLGAMHPHGPYPILQLRGEQGSAKSTTASLLRLLIDPNKALLRSPPRNEHDLVIAARNSWILALDNLSVLPGWLSDALCRLSTGGGFSTRKLFEDEDEVVFDARRPMILTGIEEFAIRSDLLDRVIEVVLKPVAEGQRRDEATLRAEFHDDRPLILGALVDAVSCALHRINEVRLASTPRMADFVRWIVAAEPALPWQPGEFLEAYARNRQGVHDTALCGSPIGPALLALMSNVGRWEGSASELLRALAPYANMDNNRSALIQGWPRSPHALSNMLTALAPNLRARGIRLTRPARSANKRWVLLEDVGDPSSQSSSSSPDAGVQPKVDGSSGTVNDAQSCSAVHPDAA